MTELMWLSALRQALAKERFTRADLEALYAELDDSGQTALAPLMEALGGSHAVRSGSPATPPPPDAGQLLWRTFFEHLNVHRGEPLWSSFVLRRGIDALSRTSNAPMVDAFRTLREMLGGLTSPITSAMKNFLRALMTTFLSAGHGKDIEHLFGLTRGTSADSRLTEAQAYLDFRLLPETSVSLDELAPILERLAASESWDEVAASLRNEIPTLDPHGLLADQIERNHALTALQRSRLHGLVDSRRCGPDRSDAI